MLGQWGHALALSLFHYSTCIRQYPTFEALMTRWRYRSCLRAPCCTALSIFCKYGPSALFTIDSKVLPLRRKPWRNDIHQPKSPLSITGRRALKFTSHLYPLFKKNSSGVATSVQLVFLDDADLHPRCLSWLRLLLAALRQGLELSRGETYITIVIKYRKIKKFHEKVTEPEARTFFLINW